MRSKPGLLAAAKMHGLIGTCTTYMSDNILAIPNALRCRLAYIHQALYAES